MAKIKKTGGSGSSKNSRAKAETASAKKSTKSKPKDGSKPKKPKADTAAIGGLETFEPLVFEGMLGSLFGRGRKARSAKKDALHEAQQLCYQAMETRDPRRRIELARQALAISPDCADAYVLLAQMTGDLAEATQLNGIAVEAGMNALGPETFEEAVGHFWGLLETRPYMRARLALAQCLWEAGECDQAVSHYRDMLRLNPGDNQGIRYILAACLIDLERDDEAAALVDEYKDDATAAWAYASALIAFRRGGDSEDARMLLAEAKKTNPHVPAYLLGKKKMPKHLPDMIGFGDESEAIAFVGDYGSGWAKTSGAVAWLRSQ
jgi:tetratricopeptide (TPR) repeat protein